MNRSRLNRRIVILALVLGMFPGLALTGQAPDKADRRAVRKFLVAARSALQEGRSSEAQTYLDSLLAVDPGNQDAHYMGAQLKLSAGDTLGAVSILEEGLAQSPLAVRLKLLTARIHIAQGRNADADELLTRVAAMRPKDSEVGYLRGLLALAENDTLQTLDLWEQALETKLEGGQ
jgi:predicted Zn-dependent protease